MKASGTADPGYPGGQDDEWEHTRAPEAGRVRKLMASFAGCINVNSSLLTG